MSSETVEATGSGTIMLRRRNPTAFSTEPFSCPEWGLQYLVRMPVCARKAENSDDSRTTPATRLPASVALSSTASGGTPPTWSNTVMRPSTRHSPRSDSHITQNRALECGQLTASSCSSTSSPATTALACP